MTTTLRGLVVGDDPAAWRAAGFPVVGDRFTVGGVTVRLAGWSSGRGVLGWQLDPPGPGPVDGLPTAVASDAGGGVAAAPADAAPSGVLALDHVVVATPDLERTTAALARLGLVPRRTVDAARGDAGVRYRFVLLGTCVLELIGPVTASGDEPARFAGLAFTARDLAAVPATTGPPRPAVQPGREIVTLRTDELAISVPVAVLSPRPGR